MKYALDEALNLFALRIIKFLDMSYYTLWRLGVISNDLNDIDIARTPAI